MRFLLLPMRFPIEPGNSYLTTELADALLDAAHQVRVLQLDWESEPGGSTQSLVSERGIAVDRVFPRAIGKPGSFLYRASKFVLSARHVGREARHRLTMNQFDCVIAWMPAIAFAPVVRQAARAGVPSRQLIIWDFFPDHHAEIGRVPGGLVRWLARRWEQSLVRTFTTIFCTLPANCDYLRRRFRLAERQQVRIAPVWTTLEMPAPVDRAEVRSRYSLPAEAPIAVFGGQIAAGRGFEQMLAAAEGSPLAFLFVGDGPMADDVSARAKTAPNVFYLPAMPSADFQELLSACDVGLVATVPGVTSQTMPSKTFAYLKAGLPVVAAVEPGNEFAALLEQRALGRAVPFGDPDAFQREAAALATDDRFRKGLAERIHNCLAEIFDVRLAVSAILEAAGARQDRNRKARKPALNTAWTRK